MTDASAANTVVPMVDIGAWTTGDAEERRRIAESVDEACRAVGFMQILGHGIDDTTIDGLRRAIDWFFALPEEIKRSTIAPSPSINRGYTPPRAERLSYSLGVVTPDDLFEAFNVGASQADFPHLELDPVIYAEDIWPDTDGADAFERGVETWFAAAAAVARRMTEIFAIALGLSEDHFAAYTDHSIDVLRLNHYRVPEFVTLGDEMGMGAHTDYGIVTVLWADPVPGLEILGHDGNWLSIVPQPGALLINLGDLLARWSNDRWLSTMHRVVPPRDEHGRLIRRRSAAMFHDGNADAVIATLETCRNADGTSTYDEVTVAEHLAQKLGGSRGLELNDNAAREAARIVPQSQTLA